jgi:hypothetical protein
MPYPGGDWGRAARIGAEKVRLRSSDGVELSGWWKPVAGAKLATLFLHGNAGNVTHRAEAMEEIAAAGSSVFVLDYRGYGRSTGSPGESGLYRDAEAAYQWLIGRGFAGHFIVLHGESLGTAVAADLASRLPSAGLILEAPFPSARSVAEKILPVVGPLVTWGFDTQAKLARVHVPVLVIHGDRDEIIDPHLGLRVFAAAGQPKRIWVVHGAGHNDIVETAGPAYRENLAAFHLSLLAQIR